MTCVLAVHPPFRFLPLPGPGQGKVFFFIYFLELLLGVPRAVAIHNLGSEGSTSSCLGFSRHPDQMPKPP